MPRELPRRELEHEAQTEQAYTQKTQALEQNRGIKNTRRWTGVEKVPVTLAPDVIKQYSAQVRSTVADMKKLVDFSGIGGARAAESVKQRSYAVRGDLPGFWNDFKQELASRNGASGNAQADAALNTTLDWLELAERQGGLGTWLEQWNAMLASPWSWDMLADSAGKVKQSIEFCKEIVKEGFGDLKGQNRTDLLFALDGIASEIARQADELLGGNRLDLGKRFDAISERLKDVNPRAGISSRLHSAYENAALHQAWSRELPDTIRQRTTSPELSNSLQAWQDAVADVNDVMSGAHQDNDEIQAAKAVDDAAARLGQCVQHMTFDVTAPSAAYDPDSISLALHVYRGLTTEILAAQKQLTATLTSLNARKALQSGPGTASLSHIDFAHFEPTKSVFYSSREFAQRKQLDEFWRQGKTYVDQALRDTTRPTYVAGMADAFGQATGQNLENLLSLWTGRNTPTLLSRAAETLSRLGIHVNVNDPKEVSYTLAWELIATLRNLKQRSETILATVPAQRAFVRNTLEAIAQVVTTELQEDPNLA